MLFVVLKEKCSICGSDLECLDSTDCWCFKMPKLTQDELDENGCMCKNCLMKKYQESLFKKDDK